MKAKDQNMKYENLGIPVARNVAIEKILLKTVDLEPALLRSDVHGCSEPGLRLRR